MAPETAAVVPAPGVQTVTKESLEFEVACERSQRPKGTVAVCHGTGRAEWALWLVCGCAPGYVLYCGDCKTDVVNDWALNCCSCGRDFYPGSAAYALVEPLNRSS